MSWDEYYNEGYNHFYDPYGNYRDYEDAFDTKYYRLTGESFDDVLRDMDTAILGTTYAPIDYSINKKVPLIFRVTQRSMLPLTRSLNHRLSLTPMSTKGSYVPLTYTVDKYQPSYHTTNHYPTLQPIRVGVVDVDYQFVDATYEDLAPNIVPELVLNDKPLETPYDALSPLNVDTVAPVVPKLPKYHRIRKQWGGVPRYASIDRKEAKKSLYNLQRRGRYHMVKRLPTYQPFNDYRALIERLNRSIAHRYKRLEATYKRIPYVSEEELTSDTGPMFTQFEDYASSLLQARMTPAQYTAFKEYTSTSNFDDLLLDEFNTHGLNAFYRLMSIIDKFISNEWYLYSQTANYGRREIRGQNLNEEQVNALQSSDKTFLEHAMRYENLKKGDD